MSLAADRREWDDLARRDAMWAVASQAGRRGAWDVAAFLETGEAEVAGIMDGLGRERLMPATGRALDFGCGLGRLTRALATRFDEVVGVDLSAAMVEQARRLHADTPAATFLVNARPELAPLDDESFDLVLSLIALQHVSRRVAIRRYLAELVRVTRPGGTLVLQLPSRVAWRVRLHPLRLANRALRRLPAVPDALLARLVGHSMSLTALPEPEVRAVLEAAGATVVAAFPDGRTGSNAVPSLCYVATRGGAAAA